MANRVRHEIPKRCDEPATHMAPNGYCVCWECRKLEDGDVLWIELDRVKRCDRPRDGLGAARYEPTR